MQSSQAVCGMLSFRAKYNESKSGQCRRVAAEQRRRSTIEQLDEDVE